MTVSISYLEFARPFKGYREYYVVCHLALIAYATEHNINYVNNVDKKCYEFDDPTDLIRIRFEITMDTLHTWWHRFLDTHQGDDVIDLYKEFSNINL
jgi:hypothetical protein|tara:strand:- start:3364 stop:3654 length:291 start_codon:yes stop_codon:yes gene_type:complete